MKLHFQGKNFGKTVRIIESNELHFNVKLLKRSV